MIKKYTVPLNLDRAKGVFVAHAEKELFESLSSYLAINFGKEDKMAVIGRHYCPQFSFLTKQKNVFEDEEFIFEKLKSLSASEKAKPILALIKDKIISRMEKERPKIVLRVNENSLTDFKFLPQQLKAYIENKYFLDKVFGPADVFTFGMDDYVEWVYAYKLRE